MSSLFNYIHNNQYDYNYNYFTQISLDNFNKNLHKVYKNYKLSR